MARGGSWLRERERAALDETPPVSMDHRPRGVPLYEPACVPVSGFPSSLSPPLLARQRFSLRFRILVRSIRRSRATKFPNLVPYSRISRNEWPEK